MSLVEKRDALIKNWLEQTAEKIHEALKSDLSVDVKTSRTDLVTNMDRQIEKDFVEKIKANFPNDQIVSEEGFGDAIEAIDMEEGTVWFLDPIDGTLNFVLQEENFAVMLAVYEKGIGQQAYIYDVIQDRLYWAIKGEGVHCNSQLLPKMKNTPLRDGLFASNSMYLSEQQVNLNAQITKDAMGVRTIGSAGIESTEIAKGSVVAYVSYGLKPWDLAPGLMMVEENGGIVKQFDGSPIDLLNASPTIIGTEAAVEEIIKLSKEFF